MVSHLWIRKSIADARVISRKRAHQPYRLRLLLSIFAVYALFFVIRKSNASSSPLFAFGTISTHKRAVGEVFNPSHSSQTTIVVTTVNWMYREFLLNFHCNLQTLHLPYAPIVYSIDRQTHNFSQHLGLSSMLISREKGDDVNPGNFESTGPRSFNEITKKKLRAVLSALRSGYDVLLSDADILWCTDAVKYITEYLLVQPAYFGADVLIQPEVNYRTLNSGFYFVKANNRSRSLFEALIQNIGIGAHDQDVVNAVFCDEKYGGRRVDQEVGSVPYWCESRGAIIKVLPAEQFPSGAQVYGDKKVFQLERTKLRDMCDNGDFVVLHNNFIKAKKKKARQIVKGMWWASFESEDNFQCEDHPVEADDLSIRTCGQYC